MAQQIEYIVSYRIFPFALGAPPVLFVACVAHAAPISPVATIAFVALAALLAHCANRLFVNESDCLHGNVSSLVVSNILKAASRNCPGDNEALRLPAFPAFLFTEFSVSTSSHFKQSRYKHCVSTLRRKEQI